MEIPVRVIACGQEIDRIVRLQRISGGSPVINYRQRLWPVVGGCIYLDAPEIRPGLLGDKSGWDRLISLLFPVLPALASDCALTLRSVFGNCLPDAVIAASCALVRVGCEPEAREMLVAFLDEKHDSEALRDLAETHLYSRTDSFPRPSNDAEEKNIAATFSEELDSVEDGLLLLDWLPVEMADAPTVDDGFLRNAAREIQEKAGAYTCPEAGTFITGLDSMPEGESWDLAVSTPIARPPVTDQSNLILARMTQLGATGLEILRYFADNPGDNASHLEQVLGHSRPVVSALLNGTLRPYVLRDARGGWTCQPWVPDALEALDRVR